MGLFDYIHCDYPLPDGWDGTGAEFQTKDTDAQYMEHYTIRRDGTLWHRKVRYEDHSDPNAEGFARARGCMTPVAEGDEPVEFHGALEFYASNICMRGPGGFATESDAPPFRAEYIALYDHGRLLRMDGQHTLESTERWMPRAKLHALWQQREAVRKVGAA